jgi:FKBP-type peptidyl-prolyl cis-trans isomerase FklB
MKIRSLGILMTCLVGFSVPVSAANGLSTSKEQISYVFGVQVASQFKQQGLALDAKAFNQAINDVWSDKKLKMSPEAMQAAMQQFQKEMHEKMQQESEANIKAGKEYREKNKKVAGVVQLENGIQYRIIKKGDGKKPSPTDTVKVHYRGTLVDGKEFDSSYKRNQPMTFPVNGVIRGWQEILPMMPVGSKWNVVVPPELAYGPRGSGAIGPNATLVFDIELLSIN